MKAFKRYRILPRVLVDVSKVNTEVSLLGEKISMPICIAPAAYHKYANHEGEIGTSKAANELDTIFCVSNISSVSQSEIAKVLKNKWKQLYVMSNLSITEKAIKNIERAGYTVLVITVDMTTAGIRELDMIGKSHQSPDNKIIPDQNAGDSKKKSKMGTGQYISASFSTSLCWDIIPWIKERTNMKLVVKGIHRADDAVKAVKAGVDGIYVSNHGGRQVESTPGTIDMLALIMERLRKEGLEKKVEVYVDGGIRRGSDIFKAMAVGAKAVFCGRPALWGLGAGGKEGVVKAFELLKREFVNTMMLAGCTDPSQISREHIMTRDSLPKF
eukprot:CAMPEP_0170516730 /NCGR_PEP_ID=MMETSP0209-20121228/2877_1 /TAXON_ID=665100 ORGANISM="Litonotus pictus, Strain P1" /NCGR_SAMPLE_ID=MMETSP0209 /ASSEMBLY_ACC=CAM_ASM_000301 /LENGTH=327 /DNA_ID=CAMNT_0010801731 /DNA_START=168 /DNA_END=1151 /DNA_ORIENTATION=-